ncbi:hypothetical protein [Chachezhania antarctica]|uniref:hypothetical protein n=1 Tax=Chachezhania antarctica TaxID=2340860 RepID=UPI0013CF21B7|nr:hypothetical protein [Chachezhania antarctica]|tara:strand:+ start:3863 stop:4753 length:891 start_codon:yes stop_codon:yes gene_type:complete
MPTRPTLALHIGTIHDGADGLTPALRDNGALLTPLGSAVPRKRFYSARLEEVAFTQVEKPATLGELAPLWKGTKDGARPLHRFMSMPDTIGDEADLSQSQAFFPGAAAGPTALRRYFEGEIDTTFLLGLVNPATLISRACAGAEDEALSAGLSTIPPDSLSWLDVVTAIRVANPETPIVIWTREQLPFVWPQLMHVAAGLDTMVMTERTTDGLIGLLPDEAMTSLKEFVAREDLVEPSSLARVFKIYMEHFADPETLNEVIEVPGWDAETVRGITERYHEDVEAIATLDGVTVLTA